MATPASIFHRLPLLRRPARRLAVVGAFGGFPLMQLGYLLLVVPGRLSSAVWAPIAIALFSITLLGVFAIYGYGMGRIGTPTKLADERQRAMRDRALITSYGVVTTVVSLALGGLALLALEGPLVIGWDALLPVFIGAGLYLPVLPFAALAWTDPDVATDDEA
jgi:uncharacterized membrane protein